MNKKVLRAMYGPSAVEVVLGAVLSLILGVALAALFLVFKPVSVVNKLPVGDKVEEGMVYYVQGGKDVRKVKQLLRKQQLFIEGNSITLTEDELNAWMASNSTAPKKPEPEAKPDPEAKPAGGAKPGPKPPAIAANELNFRILNEDGKGMLQIGFPCTVDLLGLSETVIVQMQGSFQKVGDGFVYEPGTLLIGSLPAQRIPVLAAYVLEKIYSAQQLPDGDDLVAAWKKLESVSIDGGTLRLTMPK